ncbi:putative lipid-binding transport protein (Tim44 family) [Paraburkholderia sp. BL6665CI2N2]|uniref:Tim44 domain-containing protein n=1 Tax=Paraburkholderia sp. BL6665CI2N2 TaxID=1938806 RepID=UPI001065CEE3|nr:TIM44-like domain-containing protein [Paraburkholderia sp. BL6665CI2N2]TDY25217.1 putative lipid-binding transport protein (Tim44 family) [Paraburkholderia sp. BL6665CI2N2]
MSDSGVLSPRKVGRSLVRRIGLIAMVGLIMAGSLASLNAEARRMGGGRSIGRQSNSVTQQSAPSQPSQSNQAMQQRAQPAPAPAPTPAAQPNRSRWLGPIAGLAAGLGIAALLSHFGLGGAFAGAMANIIVIAIIAMIGIWLIRRFMGRKRDSAQPAYAGNSPSLNSGGTGYSQEPRYSAPPSGSYLEPQGNPLTTPTINAAPVVPAGFDSEAFLRNAKVYFVRLQAAWDAGNMDDIREFTTPEMFAEVKVDLSSRGAERNQTDVVQLNAELLGVEERANEYFASVRFSGLIREAPGAAAEPFVEVWNLSKANRPGEGWLLAGIQQVAQH